MAGCPSFNVDNIDSQLIEKIISGLTKAGATITGNNPWNVNLNQHGIKLVAAWNQDTHVAEITVTDKAWYVPCGKIKEEMIKRINEARNGGLINESLFTFDFPENV